jgi:hypothetical protein
MALDLLASDWGLFISFFDVKCHPDVLHLFGDSISPESISIHLVKGMGLMDSTWDTCPELVGRLDHTLLHH